MAMDIIEVSCVDNADAWFLLQADSPWVIDVNVYWDIKIRPAA